MTATDVGRFTAAVSRLCVNWGRKADAALFQVYRECLADLRIEDIERAVSEALKSPAEFMPVAGKIRKLALDASRKRNGRIFLEGTGWIDDPWSKQKQLPAPDRRLGPWGEDD